MCGGAVGSDACAGPMANGVVDALPSSHQPLPRERQILLDVEHVRRRRGGAGAPWLICLLLLRPTTRFTT